MARMSGCSGLFPRPSRRAEHLGVRRDRGCCNRKLTFVDAIPKSASGTILRRVVRDLATQ